MRFVTFRVDHMLVFRVSYRVFYQRLKE